MMESVSKFWQAFKSAAQDKRIRQLLYLGIIGISLAFIIIAIATNWSQLKNQEFRIDPIFAILAIILYPLGFLPTAAGWHWLLRVFSIYKPFKANLRIYAISSLPKHIPGLVWYFTSRSLQYEPYGVSAGAVIGATAMETVLLAISGFISAILIFSFQPNLPKALSVLHYLSPLAVIALLVIIIWAPGGTRMLERLIRRWRKDIPSIPFRRSALFLCLVWMFLAWIGGGVILWILTRAITPVGIELLPTMVGAWGAAGAVSLTIGIGVQGLGLREVTLGAILSLIISPMIAIVVALAFRLVLTIGEFLWVFLISIAIKDQPVTSQDR